jgi:hypothetical protein
MKVTIRAETSSRRWEGWESDSNRFSEEGWWSGSSSKRACLPSMKPWVQNPMSLKKQKNVFPCTRGLRTLASYGQLLEVTYISSKPHAIPYNMPFPTWLLTSSRRGASIVSIIKRQSKHKCNTPLPYSIGWKQVQALTHTQRKEITQKHK